MEWLRADAGGCVLVVRVRPGASTAGVNAGPDGLVIRVHAPPRQGEATAEAARLLARALGVAPSRVRLRGGARARVKSFWVQGMPPEAVKERLLEGP